MKITNTHISLIRIGDTILCRDGKIRTVCGHNIKRDSFDGITIFGDPYNLGYIPVQVVDPKTIQ